VQHLWPCLQSQVEPEVSLPGRPPDRCHVVNEEKICKLLLFSC
jgi:hypothetical protein